MKTVILTSCNNATEAHLIQGNLANEGIESIISNENFTALYPSMNSTIGSGIQILINESDAERALKVIHSNDHTVHCSNCNSKNVKQIVGKNIFATVGILIISLFSSSAFGNIKSKYHCESCGNDFTI